MGDSAHFTWGSYWPAAGSLWLVAMAFILADSQVPTIAFKFQIRALPNFQQGFAAEIKHQVLHLMNIFLWFEIFIVVIDQMKAIR